MTKIPRRRRQLDRPVHILVEPSDYVLRNVGDMAMLSAAVERLDRLMPGATIKVLTDEPGPLAVLCPAAIPEPSDGRALWLRDDFLPRIVAHRVSAHWPRRIRHHAPRLVTTLWRRKLRNNREKLNALNRFAAAVDDADLVVVTGMGGIADAFPEYASDLLETLNLALCSGRRVAMVGQGIGPLEDPRLRARAAAILPKLQSIALREKHAGVPLLHALGVDPDRIAVTGDDAIEMAHGLRAPTLGTSIGVNVRRSDYSGVESEMLGGLSRVLADVSAALGAPLVPVPISHVPGEADLDTIRELRLVDQDELDRASGLFKPADVVGQIQRCRVVVTGSYHAGIFALASGIPVVGLARSAYYVDKFRGLADIFGGGCEIVMLDDEAYPDTLRHALDVLWRTAPEIRPTLLARAELQTAKGNVAYSRLRDAVMALG